MIVSQFWHYRVCVVRVARQESENKMSPNALSIIFGPTILRSNANLPAQESLKYVPKQSRCVLLPHYHVFVRRVSAVVRPFALW